MVIYIKLTTFTEFHSPGSIPSPATSLKYFHLFLHRPDSVAQTALCPQTDFLLATGYDIRVLKGLLALTSSPIPIFEGQGRGRGTQPPENVEIIALTDL